jgi:hypothetical protein
MELELQHPRDEVHDVGRVDGDVILGAGIEVALGARHGLDDPLIAVL